jgi:hypothetical protein
MLQEHFHMFLWNFWNHSPNNMAEKCCENLKSHKIFIVKQKHGIERQFYVEEYILQNWALSEIRKVLTDAVMTHPILYAYGNKHKVHKCQ